MKQTFGTLEAHSRVPWNTVWKPLICRPLQGRESLALVSREVVNKILIGLAFLCNSSSFAKLLDSELKESWLIKLKENVIFLHRRATPDQSRSGRAAVPFSSPTLLSNLHKVLASQVIPHPSLSCEQCLLHSVSHMS